MTILRTSILVIAGAGALFFGSAFALSFARPMVVEARGPDLHRRQHPRLPAPRRRHGPAPPRRPPSDPSGRVLAGSATLVACLYLFGQSWLHTIVFHDYVGFAYFAYLGLAAAFLADIVFNRGRISTAILNVALNVAGATIQAVPC